MSTAEKTLSRMRNNPKDWRIEEVIAVAKNFNLLMRAKGGSHHVFSFPGISTDQFGVGPRQPIDITQQRLQK